MANIVEVQNPMNAGQVGSALRIFQNSKTPVIIHGMPGIGKSDIVRQVASDLGVSLTDIRASLTDPVDWRGLPTIINGLTSWAMPDFLPTSGSGILFLDEINRAPIMVQNALFQLILDRKLGDYSLPSDWSIVSAVNDADTGVQKMSAALSNRFAHLYLTADLESWSDWALTAGIAPMVIAFLRYRPNLLHTFDPASAANATPRSWEMLSNVLAQNPSPDLMPYLASGIVGYGPSIEFCAFYSLFRSLPNIDAILMDPDGSLVPTETSTLYAISTALGSRANDQNISQVMRYADRMPAEYGMSVVVDAYKQHPEITSTSAFTNWCIKHQYQI